MPNRDPLDIAYDLAKKVPDMERGFTIQTSYGDIVIEPGELADRVQDAVRSGLLRQWPAPQPKGY